VRKQGGKLVYTYTPHSDGCESASVAPPDSSELLMFHSSVIPPLLLLLPLLERGTHEETGGVTEKTNWRSTGGIKEKL
jgi:hypothetical protein